MDDLTDLYQDLILDHNKRPRNNRVIESCDRHAKGHNPLCGDRVTIYLTLDGDTITDLSFEGSGCAISTASASLLTEALKGKTITEANALFESFHDVVTGEAEDTSSLGKLKAFVGVRKYPARVKCATLAWHTLQAALENAQGEATVTTE